MGEKDLALRQVGFKERLAIGLASATILGGGAGEALNTDSAEASTASTVDADVVTLQMSLKGVKKFVKKCKTSASRRDLPRQAPPADPLAKCKLKANVKVGYSARLACPSPYLGGELSVHGSITQKLRAKSLAKSEVPSIVRARAILSEKIKYGVKGSLTCVLPPKPPTQETNLPPNVNMSAPEHLFPSGTAEICAIATDPDGQIDDIAFKVNRGSFISGEHPGNDADETCITYRAPSTTGDVIAEVDAFDNDGAQAHDQRTFPVVPDNF